MKLRNKKTGEIVERSSIVTLRYKISSSSSSLVEAEEFGSIEQLNEEWEDYKPAEPLIKDPKIRKAVRAWAEASDIEAVYLSSEALCWIEGFAKIEFAGNRDWYKELEEFKRYTLAELCGGEGECEN